MQGGASRGFLGRETSEHQNKENSRDFLAGGLVGDIGVAFPEEWNLQDFPNLL